MAEDKQTRIIKQEEKIMATQKNTSKATEEKDSATVKKSTAKKTGTTAKKTTAKRTAAAAKKPTAKKTGTTAKKTSSSGTSVKVTATEKKLLELYREADSDTKKAAMALLKGEKSQLGGVLDAILENKTIMNTVTSLFK